MFIKKGDGKVLDIVKEEEELKEKAKDLSEKVQEEVEKKEKDSKLN